MPLIQPIAIPEATTVSDLRQSVIAALDRIINTLNNEKQTSNLNMQGFKIINCADPLNSKDVVNVEYLKQYTQQSLPQVLGFQASKPGSKSTGVHPYCWAYSTGANQTISNNTWTSITFNQDASLGPAIHSTSVNPTRFTAPQAGVYVFFFQADFITNATGIRATRFFKNNATILSQTTATPNASANIIMQCSWLNYLIIGDYIEGQVLQSSGGNLDCQTGFGDTQLIIYKLA